MKKIIKSPNYEKYSKAVLPFFKKEKNQKNITAVLTISASIFFLIFAISPTLSTIAKLQREITDNRIVDEKLNQKIYNLTQLSDQYGEIEEDIPYVLDAVPQKPEAPTLVAQIQSLASNNSVDIVNIKISPINLTNQVSTKSSSFNYELSSAGNYENINRFMSDLVNMQRVLTVESILISAEGENHFVQATIKGSAFYKK